MKIVIWKIKILMVIFILRIILMMTRKTNMIIMTPRVILLKAIIVMMTYEMMMMIMTLKMNKMFKSGGSVTCVDDTNRK